MAQGYKGDLEFLGTVLQQKIPEEEGPAKKIANTITALVGALISIAAAALTLPIDLPDWSYLAIIAVTTLGTALGVRTTKNGFSESQIRKLRRWQSEWIDQNHDLPADVEDVNVEEAGGHHRAEGSVPAREILDRVASFGNETHADLSQRTEEARRRWFDQ